MSDSDSAQTLNLTYYPALVCRVCSSDRPTVPERRILRYAATSSSIQFGHTKLLTGSACTLKLSFRKFELKRLSSFRFLLCV